MVVIGPHPRTFSWFRASGVVSETLENRLADGREPVGTAGDAAVPRMPVPARQSRAPARRRRRGRGDRVTRPTDADARLAGPPTAVAGTRLEDMPTCELLTWLLSVAEAEPRPAPDDVVALVRCALERVAYDDGRLAASDAGRTAG
jgi:hypothetical protein